MYSRSRFVNVRMLCVSAMLVAVEIVLNRFCSINTLGLKIGFSFVSPVVAAMLYGPVVSAVVYGLADFIGSNLFPIGPYHPGFTVCAVLMGLMYGLFLYRGGETAPRWMQWKRIRLFPNMLVPTLFNTLILGLCINTLWVSMLSGKRTYWGWFVYRLPEYAILIPVILLLIPVLLRMTDMLRKTGLVTGTHVKNTGREKRDDHEL